ncbi:MAG: right-handed parallel beta-helix repeat-containing protein [Candidatus Hydrogenedentes bacterium]|nr:right-handed parallel beta-helix repeat-containing protein [Candidatus Hydrogenedentota bacterium]
MTNACKIHGGLLCQRITVRHLCACVAILLSCPAFAAVWYVNKDNASQMQDGTSWTTAFNTVQAAIDAAASGGGEVWVAQGVYGEPRTSMMHEPPVDTGSIVMKAGVHLYGGFLGDEITRTERDWAAYPAVLDGSKARDGQPAYHVVVGANDATLDGFTVTGGAAIGNPMTGQWLAGSGGGMHNWSSSPTIANCTFEHNEAESVGGGMYNGNSSSSVIANCVFRNNSAADGGGFGSGNSLSKLSGCTFLANDARTDGGGMYAKGGSLVVSNCVLEDNSSIRIGGGLLCSSAAATVSNCMFRHNSGGGLFSNDSTIAASNCVFVGNRAWGFIVGSSEVSETVVRNCTFVRNLEAGMYIGYYSKTTVTNCIFWDNLPRAVFSYSSSASVSFSNVQMPEGTVYPGAGNMNADPKFLSRTFGDYRLWAGSPCVDAGTASDAPTTDILGEARPQGAGVDMGAYEFPTGFSDTDGDLLPDTWEGDSDLDQDGRPNSDDLDSDGDGTNDDDEASVGRDAYRPYRICLVDKKNTSGIEDGQSWPTALTTIQSGIDAAAASGEGEVWVAHGIYDELRTSVMHDPPVNTASVVMHERVSLYGGFAGTETERNQRDWSTNVTVIDGSISRVGEAAYHVIVGAHKATLDGFTITGGDALGNLPPESANGGGMYNEACSPIVRNCILIGNSADGSGGGMENLRSAAEVANCTFRQNSADTEGGGINNNRSLPQLMDCKFVGNSAAQGAGIYSNGFDDGYGLSSNPIVSRCVFERNSANEGGGIYNTGYALRVSDCIFTGNSASRGAGVYSYNCLSTIGNCVFRGNSAGWAGGALYYELYIGDDKGDVRNKVAHPERFLNWDVMLPRDDAALSGSTNLADGVVPKVAEPTSRMTNCTLSRNSAQRGGGIYVEYWARVALTNCILWEDVSQEIFVEGGPYLTVNYCDVQMAEGSRYFGIGNINADPLFLYASFGDLRLRRDSPCLNVGTGNGAPAFDMLGVTRPQGPGVDMGAYEFPSDSADTDADGIPDVWEGNADVDGDGTANLDDLDSDGDGLDDESEISAEGNPYHAPDIWYVDRDSNSGVEDGRTWETAFTTVQAAIDAALPLGEDEVWVAEGVYDDERTSVMHDPPVNTGSLLMKEGVHLYGGFAGTEIARTQRDWAKRVTVLDGSKARGGQPAYHVVVGASYAVLDGFTITGGVARGEDWDGSSRGAGMVNSYFNSPTIVNCTFRDNWSEYQGGAMYNVWSSATVVNSIFLGNATASSGSAMYNVSSSVTITNCTFSHNSAGWGGLGGCVTNANATTRLANCIMWGNGLTEVHNGDGASVVTHSNVQMRDDSVYPGTGNINADPVFLWDLRIAGTSPCIDVGTEAGAPQYDVLGTPRPQGAGVDMGAYEFPSDSLDADADFLPDSWEGENDLDADGTPNTEDVDSDGDGVGDTEEAFGERNPYRMLKVWYVDRRNLSKIQDGSSWATAFAAIQPAIDAADATGNDAVWVAEGIYDEPRVSFVDDPALNAGSLVMRRDIPVYGGFSGMETARDQRDWRQHVTVIDGSKARDGEPAYHVVVASRTTILDGFTITGGAATGSDVDSGSGGGMYIRFFAPVVSNCTFTRNTARDGGGIACPSASPAIINCVFTGNSAVRGGGMYSSDSARFSVSNCSFIDNSAEEGGALANYYYAYGTIADCSFNRNSAADGGGIYNGYWLDLTDCTFSENLAVHGGGMAKVGSGQTVSNCIFNDNIGTEDGGGMYNETAYCEVNACIFRRNTAGRGGGIANNGYNKSEVVNCSFVENAADLGGGIFSEDPYEWNFLTIFNTTFSVNLATSGGGIYSNNAIPPTITNSIFWGDSPDEIHNESAFPVVTFSDVEIPGGGVLLGTNSMNRDPLFYWDFRIGMGSPCINAGTNIEAPTEDILGTSRQQGGRPDMGAYEYPSDSPDSDGDTIPDGWEGTEDLDGDGMPNHLDTDSDGDGLDDAEEAVNGPNPYSADTDEDGMPDGWERTFGLDPRADDSADDADRDGLTNGVEYGYGTSPIDADTDDNGIPDNEEDYSGSVSGVVRDELRAIPIVGAEVCLLPEVCMETDGEGAYSFSGLAPGDYEVHANAARYLPCPVTTLQVGPASNTSLDLLLYPRDDIDVNGAFDAVDVQRVIAGALGIGLDGMNSDVNDDAQVNAVDVQLVINAVLGVA